MQQFCIHNFKITAEHVNGFSTTPTAMGTLPGVYPRQCGFRPVQHPVRRNKLRKLLRRASRAVCAQRFLCRRNREELHEASSFGHNKGVRRGCEALLPYRHHPGRPCRSHPAEEHVPFWYNHGPEQSRSRQPLPRTCKGRFRPPAESAIHFRELLPKREQQNSTQHR